MFFASFSEGTRLAKTKKCYCICRLSMPERWDKRLRIVDTEDATEEDTKGAALIIMHNHAHHNHQNDKSNISSARDRTENMSPENTVALAAAAADCKPSSSPIITHPAADQTVPVPLPPLGSRGFPYLETPDGSWVCQYCHSMPDFVPGKSTWKVDGGFPPPAGFVAMHMNKCPGSYSQGDVQQAFSPTTIAAMPAAGSMSQSPKSCMTAEDLRKETFECYYCGKRFPSWDHCKDHILQHMQHYCPELIGLVELLPEHAIASTLPTTPNGIWPNQMAAPSATKMPCETMTGPVYWNPKLQKFPPGSGKYFCLGCKVQFKKWKFCKGHMQLCCPAVLAQARIQDECRVKPSVAPPSGIWPNQMETPLTITKPHTRKNSPAAHSGIWPNQKVAPSALLTRPHNSKSGPVCWNESELKFVPGSGKFFCLGCKVHFTKWKFCRDHMNWCCPAILVGKDHRKCLVVEP